ncbi:hypothetical protein RND81_03G118700 [Saponaria officinalis]|uniref:F-box domain-containing protein n=1 Tax=Saponaria officinalis TaxID=3572 RepID=A0AAW1LZQ2_SAPOF
MAALPQELIFDILSRLPVKSLLRFKSVCKRWYSMIHDNEFIAVHLERSRNRHFYLLQAIEWLPAPDNFELITDIQFPIPTYRLIEDPDPSKSYQRHIFALVQAHKLDEAIHVETPNPKITNIASKFNGRRYLDVDIVGSIDGLVCLTFNWGKCIVIWNPSTSQYYRVPDAKIPFKGSLDCSFGFAKHNGHKVVRVLSDHAGGQLLSSKVRAEVYNLQTKTWTEIANPPQVLFSQRICGTILKGVPYWPMDFDVYASEKSEWIISFCASKDTFSVFKRPDFAIGEDEFTWKLGTMLDGLVTFVQKRDFSIDVWEKMNDEVGDKVSWRKLLALGPVAGIENWVGCWKNGEFLVSDDHEYALDKEMFLYDVWSQETKTFPEIRPEDEQRSSIEVCLYSESLILPWYSS